MKITIETILSSLTIFGSFLFFVTQPASADVKTEPLLQTTDLNYIGAFRIPSGTFGCSDESRCAFYYAGRGLGYNSINDTLFIYGHVYNGWLAEVNIPALVNSSNINNLKTGTIRQNFIDVWNGTLGYLGPGGSPLGNGGVTGGVLVNGQRLVISQYAYYDAGYEAVLSHATVNANWESGLGFSGMKTVGPANASGVGQTAGYMAWIPFQWRSLMGGSALTGISNISIVTRTSLGPSAWVFDPNQIGVTNPVPATQVVGYPDGHWTLGDYSQANSYMGGSDTVAGVVWPTGSRTVLFFGRHGDTYCYGTGAECNDPADDSKGGHGYPYHARIWAYDANDLFAVKSGTKNPWDIVPYWVYNFEESLNGLIDATSFLLGASYDESSKRIYISADHGDGVMPLIHAFQVNVSTTPDTTPPTSPTTLTATAPSQSSISVSWTASTDNIGVTGYIVERCQGSGCSNFTQVGTPTASPFVDSGLTANTFYNYHVRAIDGAGNLSGWSNVVGATTQAPDTQAPTTPSNLSATAASFSTVNLTWTASTDNVGVTDYRVERCSGSGCANFVQIGTPTSNNYSDTGLSASTLYRYQVRAVDGANNNSTYSSIAQATTQTAPPVAYLQGAATTDTTTATFPGNNTAGNTIIAAISWGNNAAPTCSDSQGNTYTIVTNTYDSTNNQSLGVCYASNIKTGANTFTLNVGGASSTRILIHEYSGIASSSPVDVTKTNIANATTTANNVTSTAATTTQNNDLIFGAVMDDTGTTSITAGTNFTQRHSVNNKDLASQDFLQSTTGSIASTQTFGTAHRYLSHMVAFKTTATASSVTCNTVTTANFSQAAYNSYGAPFDAFQTSTNLINATCSPSDPHTIQATLGQTGDTTRIVYTKGYYYAGSAWTQYSGTCTGALNGDWCQGSVSAMITNPNISTASASAPAYFVGMTCSVQGGSWRCGCRDTSCTNFYWQIQGAGQ